MLAEFEIIDELTEKKFKEFQKFIRKNIDRTEVIGVECFMSEDDLIDGITTLRDITEILADMDIGCGLKFILTMGAETEGIDVRIKIKLFLTINLQHLTLRIFVLHNIMRCSKLFYQDGQYSNF